MEQREIRLLKADGILPFSPTTPLSPLSPASLHPSRLLSALKSLPFIKRFYASAAPDAASSPVAGAPQGVAPGVSRDLAVDSESGDVGIEGIKYGERGKNAGGMVVADSPRQRLRIDGSARRASGGGGGVAGVRSHILGGSTANPPAHGNLCSPRGPSLSDSTRSVPASIGTVLKTGVVMEEAWGQTQDGFVTPVNVEGSRDGDLKTPTAADGCGPDGEFSSGPPDGFTTPKGDDGFRTPV